METAESIINHYTARDEDSRLTSRHGSVEFLTTVRFIDKYLPADAESARILEIGAGTGRYSHHYARRGYAVDAVELVPKNIEIFRANTQPGERVTVTEGNALDLSGFASDAYDIVLLLGPMYHLYAEGEKLRAMSEALRVAKTGGVIFTAYCVTDATHVQYGFVRGNISRYYNDSALCDRESFDLTSTPEEVFELVRKYDVDRLVSRFDIERLHYAGTDMATNFIRETVDGMDDAAFELYMKYHLSICQRSDLIGATHHVLDVTRKRSDAVITDVTREELEECLGVIRRSFAENAAALGISEENCPAHTAFMKYETLCGKFDGGRLMYALKLGGIIAGFVSLDVNGGGFYMNNLAVLPEYRGRGFGGMLVEFCKARLRRFRGGSLDLGIMNGDARLREFYLSHGFKKNGTREFPHLPFTVGFFRYTEPDHRF